VPQQITSVTAFHSTTDQGLQQNSNSIATRRRGKRKRKVVKEDEDPEKVMKGLFKRDSDDEEGPRKHPPGLMSGRRHSGWRNCV